MRAISLVALVFVIFAAPFVSAEAVPLSDRRIEIIRQNCTTAQQTLQLIQRNEAAARVNRGREYESTLRLLAAFNSRAALNKINVPVLTAATTEMEKKFAAFRADYIAYDDQLSDALQLKCREQPVTFYDQLTLAREARVKVARDIKDIRAILDQYQQALNDLRAQLSAGETSQ